MTKKTIFEAQGRLTLLPEQVEIHELLGGKNFNTILSVFQKYIKTKAQIDRIPYLSDKYFQLYKEESERCFPQILKVLRDINTEDSSLLSSLNFQDMDDYTMFERVLRKDFKKAPESKAESTMQLEIIANCIKI
jgi:predicted N-acyltransferase